MPSDIDHLVDQLQSDQEDTYRDYQDIPEEDE